MISGKSSTKSDNMKSFLNALRVLWLTVDGSTLQKKYDFVVFSVIFFEVLKFVFLSVFHIQGFFVLNIYINVVLDLYYSGI